MQKNHVVNSSTLDEWGWGLLFALGGLFLLIPTWAIYSNISGGTVLQRSISFDGKAEARISVHHFAAATDVDRTNVELRSGFDPLWTSVFTYVDRGAKMKVSWIDSHTLQVDCDDTCDHLDVEDLVRKWNDIHIRYSSDLIRRTRWEKLPE